MVDHILHGRRSTTIDPGGGVLQCRNRSFGWEQKEVTFTGVITGVLAPGTRRPKRSE